MKVNNNPIIHIENVTKAVQQKELIKSYTMSINERSIYGLLGPNGAGKTTLFKLLTGFIYPTVGKIEILGMDIATKRNAIIKNVGSLIEAPIFYEHLSAIQNINIHLSYMGLKSVNAPPYLEMVGLGQNGTQPVSEFSMGMRQRLGVARAISHQPKLLILDEPINGLDPMGIRIMRNLFKSLVDEHGMTILISSHILSEIEQIANTIGVISNGKKVEEVNLASIKKKYPAGLEDYFFDVLQGGL